MYNQMRLWKSMHKNTGKININSSWSVLNLRDGKTQKQINPRWVTYAYETVKYGKWNVSGQKLGIAMLVWGKLRVSLGLINLSWQVKISNLTKTFQSVIVFTPTRKNSQIRFLCENINLCSYSPTMMGIPCKNSFEIELKQIIRTTKWIQIAKSR